MIFFVTNGFKLKKKIFGMMKINLQFCSMPWLWPFWNVVLVPVNLVCFSTSCLILRNVLQIDAARNQLKNSEIIVSSNIFAIIFKMAI